MTDSMSVSPPPTATSSPAEPPSSPPAPQPDRGFVEDIILNVFEPGVNGSVLIFLNLAFVLLLLTLVGVTALVGLDLHILLLIVLAIGLMAGFNWFIAQLPNPAPDSQTLSTAQYSETKKQE